MTAQNHAQPASIRGRSGLNSGRFNTMTREFTSRTGPHKLGLLSHTRASPKGEAGTVATETTFKILVDICFVLRTPRASAGSTALYPSNVTLSYRLLAFTNPRLAFVCAPQKRRTQ